MFFTTARHANVLDILYIIKEQNLTIDLQADGSANVSDCLTYQSYHAATFHHTLHLLDYDIKELSISLIDPLSRTRQDVRLSDSREPLTYQITDVSDEYQRLQINHAAKHERVTFVFDYVIDNFVTTYSDLAELTTLQTQAGLIQEDADVTARLLLPAMKPVEELEPKEGSKPSVSAKAARPVIDDSLEDRVVVQLSHTGDQAQLVTDRNGDRPMIRLAIPADAMTEQTALSVQVDPGFFPDNPNAFLEHALRQRKD